MRENGRLHYWDLFNGKPVSYKRVMEETPNASRVLDVLLQQEDYYGQTCFDENGNPDILVYKHEKSTRAQRDEDFYGEYI